MKQNLPHALLDGNWKHLSDNATDISLHDHYITKFIQDGNDIILVFEEGFFIDKTHPENNTGEHQFSTSSAIILKDGNLIIEDSFGEKINLFYIKYCCIFVELNISQQQQ